MLRWLRNSDFVYAPPAPESHTTLPSAGLNLDTAGTISRTVVGSVGENRNSQRDTVTETSISEPFQKTNDESEYQIHVTKFEEYNPVVETYLSAPCLF